MPDYLCASTIIVPGGASAQNQRLSLLDRRSILRLTTFFPSSSRPSVLHNSSFLSLSLSLFLQDAGFLFPSITIVYARQDCEGLRNIAHRAFVSRLELEMG